MSDAAEFLVVTRVVPVVTILFLLWLVFFLTRLVSRSRRRWLSRSAGAVGAFTVRVVVPREIRAEPWPFRVPFTQWATLVISPAEARIYTGELRPYAVLVSLERSSIASIAITEFEWRQHRQFGVEMRLRSGGRFVLGIASLKSDAPRRASEVEASLVAAELQAWLDSGVVPTVTDALVG